MNGALPNSERQSLPVSQFTRYVPLKQYTQRDYNHKQTQNYGRYTKLLRQDVQIQLSMMLLQHHVRKNQTSLTFNVALSSIPLHRRAARTNYCSLSQWYHFRIAHELMLHIRIIRLLFSASHSTKHISDNVHYALQPCTSN